MTNTIIFNSRAGNYAAGVARIHGAEIYALYPSCEGTLIRLDSGGERVVNLKAEEIIKQYLNPEDFLSVQVEDGAAGYVCLRKISCVVAGNPLFEPPFLIKFVHGGCINLRSSDIQELEKALEQKFGPEGVLKLQTYEGWNNSEGWSDRPYKTLLVRDHVEAIMHTRAGGKIIFGEEEEEKRRALLLKGCKERLYVAESYEELIERIGLKCDSGLKGFTEEQEPTWG